MKFGFSHEIFDVFGAGVGDGEVLNSDALAHFLARGVVDGTNSFSRKVVPPKFNVHEHPLSRFVL